MTLKNLYTYPLYSAVGSMMTAAYLHELLGNLITININFKQHMVLTHHHGARHFEQVSNDVPSAIADYPAVITLCTAVEAEFRNPVGSARAHYSCKNCL